MCKRERMCVYVCCERECVLARERDIVCVCKRERVCEWEWVCVCVCIGILWERECACEGESVCACVCQCMCGVCMIVCVRRRDRVCERVQRECLLMCVCVCVREREWEREEKDLCMLSFKLWWQVGWVKCIFQSNTMWLEYFIWLVRFTFTTFVNS